MAENNTISFPCVYPIKVIGADTDQFATQVLEIIATTRHNRGRLEGLGEDESVGKVPLADCRTVRDRGTPYSDDIRRAPKPTSG